MVTAPFELSVCGWGRQPDGAVARLAMAETKTKRLDAVARVDNRICDARAKQIRALVIALAKIGAAEMRKNDRDD